MKEIIIIIGVFILILFSIMIFHELGHIKINQEYGLDSYITLTNVGLKTNISGVINCAKLPCGEITEKHKEYDESWGLYYDYA